MKPFQKEFIKLIRSAFSNEQNDISPEFDWDEALNVAKKHNVVATIYYGALNCNIPKDCEAMRELFSLTCKSLVVSQRQMFEIEKIEAAFEEENIEYMPLKGALLKSVYPKPEMRSMGDADILIKLEQYHKIEAIMKRLGFEFRYESDHELVWKNPSLFLELHKSVMTTYNKDFYGYFGSGWGVAHRVANRSRYEMKPEDFYLYLFVHFTKHYRISGIGIKHLLDLWVFTQTCSKLDWKYITSELKKINLYKFHVNIMKTIDVWFSGDNETDETNLITNVIFNSGEYGTADMTVVNRAIRDHNGIIFRSRLVEVFKSVFLPYRLMKEKYQILKSFPFMLPIMWGVRCVQILVLQRKRLSRYIRELMLINSLNVEEHTNALRFVGLDFNYEE